jgi:serine/threonine-protein kinase
MSALEVSGFELLERLGEGGMATVWKARQVSLDRIVAIKILHTRLARDAGDLLRFQAEAQAAAKLKHPGIVQVYDFREEHGLYYFVMEYVEGYTAGEWLRRKGALPEKEVLLLADCVADALQYAWNRERIIHCDIKPENVMIDADGTVKVADLGLARTISVITAESAADEVLGTPAYMSPEQALGEPNLDFRTDVYSLGGLIYHLVTGHMLFEGNPEERIMEMQIGERMPDPIEMNPRLSSGICWLIEKMLAKDRAWRHESWEAVRTDIERVRNRQAPLVKGLPEGSSTIQRSRRRAKAAYGRARGTRRPASILGVLLPLVLAAGAVGWLVYHQLQAEGRWQRIPGLGPRVETPAPVPAVRPGEPAQPRGEPSPQDEESQAGERLEAARRWAAENPDQYAQAVERFEAVAADFSGTPQAFLARNEITRMLSEKQQAVDTVMAALDAEAERSAQEARFDKAIRLYQTYGGRFSAETAGTRAERVKQLRMRQQRAEDENLKREWHRIQALRSLVENVVTAVLAGETASAVASVEQALQDPRLEAHADEFRRLRRVLEEAEKGDERIMASFREQEGNDVTVYLRTGRTRVRIVRVHGSTVEALEERNVGTAVAQRRLTFGPDDLTSGERLARLGAEGVPGAALARGLMAFKARSYALAKEYFGTTDPLIAERLVSKAAELERGP